MDFRPLELNDDFRYALQAIEQAHKNLFITGKAGTGKSTFLNLLRRTTRRNTVVLAPTGVAALNVKGQTIHSFFKFAPRLPDPRDLRKAPARRRELYRQIELLIMDEISMVRADLLDHIDRFLRINRDNDQAFGGVQVVMVGDLFQLPPVVSSDVERQFLQKRYQTPFFFSARVFSDDFEWEAIEFGRVYRQENRHFLRLLEAIRSGRADYEDIETLNERYLPDFEAEDWYITLTTTNRAAEQINRRRMDQLKTPAFYFPARLQGAFSAKSTYPADINLELKEGAQVMFLRNDPQKRFFNGTIGRITGLTDSRVKVRITAQGRDEEVNVERFDWELIRYTLDEKDPGKIVPEVTGTFTQFPLKPAWAITIHKSQGKTFERAVIDLGRGAFAHGQLYVALSRCRSLEGIILRQRIRPADIIIHEAIPEFYERYIR